MPKGLIQLHYLRLAKCLPRSIQAALFGDRLRHGPVANPDDEDWQRWRKLDLQFYDENQRDSAGAVVNAAGYRIMRKVPIAGLNVLEIGPGSLDHIAYWTGKPVQFIAVDINEGFLQRAVERLEAQAIPYRTLVNDSGGDGRIPVDDASIDLVLSFYSLEHLHPLEGYLSEIVRILKPGGMLAGAIPCEGGIGWGLGRYLTTRRWLLRHGIPDPGKIIAWEHPNFADHILTAVENKLRFGNLQFWPFRVRIIDFNLVATFTAVKARET
ncbi:class I SAM-dependent methyltransferase [Bosea sp. (in: a-proteobacteria)]